MSLKGRYVGSARVVRSALGRVGALDTLDAWAQRSRIGTWARSLLSIYDIEELAALDVPWWTFDSIGRVDGFLAGRRTARVFEWGSGASTIWLSRRAASVTAVEHDAQWADRVRELLPEGADVDLRVVAGIPAVGAPGEVRSAKSGATDLDFRTYVEVLAEVGGVFDLIVVDGRAREACLRAAVAQVAPDGLIVVDNVERARYRRAIDELADRVDVTWTAGLTPGLPYPTRTALLRSRQAG